MLLLCLGVEMNENEVEREWGVWVRRRGFRRRGHINFHVWRGVDFFFFQKISTFAAKLQRWNEGREKKRMK